MKKLSLAGLILVFLFCACRKNLSDPDTQTQTSTNPPVVPPPHDTSRVSSPNPADTTLVPFPKQTAAAQAPAPSCALSPLYGDSIIYVEPTNGSDYIVFPVNASGQGKYFSWPVGMTIDQNTGAINLSKSETGLKYMIGFVKNGSTDTCLSTLIVGGASYADSIYVLADGANTAIPYFEADPYLTNTCASGNGCAFDINNTAASSKVIVNKTTGVIDLQKTLNGTLLGLGGAFGLLPTNGSSVTTTIYYKVNDPSNLAVQHIDVQLVYYDTKAALQNSNPGLLSGVVNKLNNLLAGHMISYQANPRPPLIVIVRRLE
ncbi:hypothetical protein ACQ86N_25150 [Puia sp. P3]|uniref:hypothetical protein n=1 Tax=Puia sp. P3 TaxID=3423952 RepID=UPI003D67FFBD